MTNWAIQCLGCGDCCGVVPFPAGFIKEHTAQIQISEFNIEDTLFKGVEIPVTEDLMCIFLTPEKRCSIYYERPEVCRLYGTIPRLKCPKL